MRRGNEVGCFMFSSKYPTQLLHELHVTSAYDKTMEVSSCELPFHRKLKQLFLFFLEGVNWRMQLQFLARVELFFKQLKGYSF